MCGRYASTRNPEDLVLEFEVEENDLEPGQGEAKYNVAPTDTVPVVVERLLKPSSEEDEEDEEGEVSVRRLRALTWGLVPSWSKERTGGARMINARAESLLEKPAYRKAAVSRRCLVPADGWYEWQVLPELSERGKPRKQPHFMRFEDGGGLAFAGIYEFWRDKALHPDDPAAWLVTFAVITTAAEPALAHIHDRMPLVLPRQEWDHWLDPAVRDADDVRAMIASPEEGRFSAVPISDRVNSVRNDGPELLEPVSAAPAEPLF